MIQTPMTPLEARALERQIAAAKRKIAEHEYIKLTYRGVPYCKTPQVTVAYY